MSGSKDSPEHRDDRFSCFRVFVATTDIRLDGCYRRPSRPHADARWVSADGQRVAAAPWRARDRRAVRAQGFVVAAPGSAADGDDDLAWRRWIRSADGRTHSNWRTARAGADAARGKAEARSGTGSGGETARDDGAGQERKGVRQNGAGAGRETGPRRSAGPHADKGCRSPSRY